MLQFQSRGTLAAAGVLGPSELVRFPGPLPMPIAGEPDIAMMPELMLLVLDDL